MNEAIAKRVEESAAEAKDEEEGGEDGDKVVDKYSGYTIKFIQYSNDEGYDAFHAIGRGCQNWDLIDPLIVCTHFSSSRSQHVLLS